MKRNIFILMALAMVFLSCATYTTGYVYSRSSAVPQHRVAYSYNAAEPSYGYGHDMSLYLDLQAVAAAFAQSYDVRQFETLLNDDSYMISNLDMNGDGYVDYLRVNENHQGNVHLFVIQAVLGMNVYQDVATVIVENPGMLNYHIEIVGDSYLYGPDYFICPEYYNKPRILSSFTRYYYSPWVSPWVWNSYPTYYHHRAPRHLRIYRRHVTDYMANHKYCHRVSYPDHCHYSGFGAVYGAIRRNDYASEHPEGSFTVRNANTPAYNSALGRAEESRRASNARDVEQLTASQRRTEVAAPAVGSSSSSSSSKTSVRSSGTVSRSSSTGSSARSSGSSSSTRSSSSGSASGARSSRR